MNKVILMGRLTRDPDVRNGADGNINVARYSLAVDRRFTDANGNRGADFISCVAFGKGAEFASKYLKKGTKIVVEGRIQTGSYDDRDGKKVYTTDVIVENHEFAESAKSQNNGNTATAATPQNTAKPDDSFMNIPDGVDEELPFN